MAECQIMPAAGTCSRGIVSLACGVQVLSGSMLHPRLQDRTDPVLPLALLLARERGRGAKSFWAPYLQLLPDQPGNGWNLEGPALAAAIRQAQQVLGEP